MLSMVNILAGGIDLTMFKGASPTLRPCQSGIVVEAWHAAVSVNRAGRRACLSAYGVCAP